MMISEVHVPDSFTATYLYHYTFILLFNLLFTSLPVIVLGGMCYGTNVPFSWHAENI